MHFLYVLYFSDSSTIFLCFISCKWAGLVLRPCGTLSLLSAALGLLSCGPVGLRVSPRAGTLSALVAPPSLVVSSVF